MSRKYSLTNFAPSLTKQSFRHDCNINNIVAKYRQTGVVQHLSARKPVYMDVSEVSDYQAALACITAADEAFASLPAIVRKEFGNDPARFADYASNPEHAENLRAWGLLKAEEKPLRVVVDNTQKSEDKSEQKSEKK